MGPDKPAQGPVLELVGLDSFSTTLGIDNPYNPTNSVELSNYAKLTLVHLTISGTTTAVCINPPPPDEGRCGTGIPDEVTLDARGRWAGDVWNRCYEGVQIQFAAPPYNSGPLVPDCPHEPTYTPQDPLTRTVVVRGQGTATWTGERPCQGCWYYTGDKAITVAPVAVNFTATATPTTVNYRDSVSLQARVSPGKVDGVAVPWNIDSVTWAPAFGTQTSPCPHNGFFTPTTDSIRTCKKSYTRSGTLTVFATVNGAQAHQSFSITVTPPSLHVTASPTSVADSAGVTFTAAVTPSTITWTPYWSWKPDVGSGGISSQCQTSEKTCTRGIWKSGWMKATVFLPEYTLIDSVHVRLIPCPTGDSILDLREVRQALNDALAASNVSDPDFRNRIERSGMFLRNLQTGQVETVRFDSLYADWCINNSYVDNFNSDTHRLLGTFHTHPHSPEAGDIVAYCPKVEVDPTTGLARPVQPPRITFGGVLRPGGSDLDWAFVDSLSLRLAQRGQPQVNEFIIDLDTVYRLTPGHRQDVPNYVRFDYKSCSTWLQ